MNRHEHHAITRGDRSNLQRYKLQDTSYQTIQGVPRLIADVDFELQTNA